MYLPEFVFPSFSPEMISRTRSSLRLSARSVKSLPTSILVFRRPSCESLVLEIKFLLEIKPKLVKEPECSTYPLHLEASANINVLIVTNRIYITCPTFSNMAPESKADQWSFPGVCGHSAPSAIFGDNIQNQEMPESFFFQNISPPVSFPPPGRWLCRLENSEFHRWPSQDEEDEEGRVVLRIHRMVVVGDHWLHRWLVCSNWLSNIREHLF